LHVENYYNILEDYGCKLLEKKCSPYDPDAMYVFQKNDEKGDITTDGRIRISRGSSCTIALDFEWLG
jgi:hypothetical protein